MDNKCERCGYIASSKENLIKHVKEEKMCPAKLSKISHIDLLNKLNPPPDLTCNFCNLLCKSKASKTTHIRYHCHLNPNKLDRKQNKTSNDISSPNNVSTINDNRIYIHKKTSTTKGLHPFTKDIDWDKVTFSNSELIECIMNENQGIVDLFISLHSHDNHKNIEWVNDKLLIYDGKGWTEVDNDMLVTHLGFLYSFIEEKWCDYQMDVRCGNVVCSIEDAVIESINDFIYNKIVDDESVLFYCNDILSEYLEILKTC
jgi:hypothetical protein